MNIIDAIRQAQKTRANVVSTGPIKVGTTDVLPGKINPEHLLNVLGNIRQADLLNTAIWEVEEETLSITYKQLEAAMRYEMACDVWHELGGTVFPKNAEEEK